MTDTTAKIRAKGLNATGVTEEIATRLADAESGHLIAVVELKVEEVHKKVDGDRRVDLIITTLEPATDKIAEDHLREFARALYYNRAVDEAQPTLDSDGPEPTVKDVLSRGQSLLEHDADGDVVGLWDGNTDEEKEQDDPYSYVHAKGGSLPGEETVCGLHATALKSLHTHADDTQVTCPTCLEQLNIDASYHGDDEDQEPEPRATLARFTGGDTA